MASLVNFMKHLRRIIPIPHKLLQKFEEEEMLTNSFYEAFITLITKPNENITIKKKLDTNIPCEHRFKNP